MAKSQHQYRVTEIPAGCSKYSIDEEVMVLVDDPPPPTYTVPDGKECAGTVMVLDEDDE